MEYNFSLSANNILSFIKHLRKVKGPVVVMNISPFAASFPILSDTISICSCCFLSQSLLVTHFTEFVENSFLFKDVLIPVSYSIDI